MLHLLLKKLAPPPPPIVPVTVVEPADFLTLAAAVLVGGIATCLVMLPIFWHMLKEWMLYDDEVKTKIFFSTYRKVSACIVANGGIAPATPKRPPPTPLVETTDAEAEIISESSGPPPADEPETQEPCAASAPAPVPAAPATRLKAPSFVSRKRSNKR